MRPVGCVEGEFSKTITLNVSTTTVGTPMYFASDSELDSSLIRTIEVVTASQNPNLEYNGNIYDNITTAMAAGACFVLSNSAREIISDMPLSVLIRSANAGKPTYFIASDVIWQSCYIYLTNNTSYSATNGFFLRVTFDKKQ